MADDIFEGRVKVGETVEQNKGRKAWDSSTMGFGAHDYQKIDPSTINPEDYANNIRGEQEHFGDVREYNSAFNKRHELTDVAIDWFARLGTVVETNAEAYAGTWVVTNMPVVHSPKTYARMTQAFYVNDELVTKGEEVTIPLVELGVVVDADNKFRDQVWTKMVKKGKVDRIQRERLTKKT